MKLKFALCEESFNGATRILNGAGYFMPVARLLAHSGQSRNQGRSPSASGAVERGAKPRLTSGGGAVRRAGGEAVQNTLCTKLLKVIALTTILLTLGTSAIGQSQTKRQTFNPDGSFWLVGEPPAGFKNFGSINLNGRRLRRIPSQGLQLNNGKTFHYKSLIVKRDNFSFTTVSLGGVYYTFSGKFLRGGIFAEQDLSDERPVLEGVLARYKSGKKVAEEKLRFSYFGGT